ncbi:RUN and FYVE domain-containing protein 1 [Desmophyllum pertusum]|uniref:RUN and FYVE domain-containing protein 1 n=1 Tax=Desmophyllum pertusum TaxID=174260 RepID=A0A9X0CZB7_9CNID|nr:RUN and FYVE domain-containing protein 1 [Desmophyllum pertusum]
MLKIVIEFLVKPRQKKTEAVNMADQLNNKLADSESERTALNTNLKIEREWRTSLQEESVKDKERIGAMQMELKQLEKLKKNYTDQEKALVEMGSHLSNSQQKVEEMKEVTQTMKDKKWAEDKDAAQCQQCDQLFNLARRKHHCRNCGGIFCNSCSDYTMPLPSSAKPVRVCDACYTTLLQRYQR